jgi:hypothetical protein
MQRLTIAPIELIMPDVYDEIVHAYRSLLTPLDGGFMPLTINYQDD